MVIGLYLRAQNKKLKIENGEFSCLGAISQRKFTALTDSGKVVSFDPTEVNFKHGYVTTVYKAQGASIKDVYVLHDNVGNNRNTYVAMTRHVDEVKLYTNIESTKNHKHLIAQLSRADERLASINFMTQAELLEQKKENMPTKTTGLREKMSNWFKLIADDIRNRWSKKPERTPPLPPKVKYECPERDIMQKVTVIRSPESLIAKTQRYKELQPKYGQQVNDQLFIARNDRDIRIIESHLAKLDNQDKLHQFKHQLRNLTKFTTKENISNCLKFCKQLGVNAFIDHSEKICAEAITSKINDDLQIMNDKFNPNIPLNGKSYNDIVVKDFKCREHLVPDDY
ncbi:hypothetical protein [Orientia tsutsugamushi]|uniref:hypothetical protein n=1 Tax=Orientia tsutsugamushi TaxID=784 RepID=UPI000D5A6790|nr:conjugal transfer protein TraA [Orientia tsutsugamushi]